MIVEKRADELQLDDEFSTDGYKVWYIGTVVDPINGDGVYIIVRKDGHEKEAIFRPDDKLPIYIKEEA